MLNELIILAGGSGTRLRPVVTGIPKCMAPVAGKPFLQYVIEHFRQQGIEKFIFALGDQHEMVEAWVNREYPLMYSQVSVEMTPLGTGGAIRKACSLATEKNVLVANGDTLFAIDIIQLSTFHHKCGADCTLSLKPMQDTGRYGKVELDQDHHIISFKEKQRMLNGLVNGGVYALHAARFVQEGLPEQFSFETDYLEKYYLQRNIYGLVQDEYFIDIGIPEDYAQAQKDLAAGK